MSRITSRTRDAMLIPINSAEAILDPFWDGQLSGLKRWRVEPGEAHGLRVWQNWCWAAFEWVRRPASGPALKMERDFRQSCEGFDRLLLSVMAPMGAIVKLIAETDRGARTLRADPAGRYKRELALDLQGATRIERVCIEIETDADGVQTGWLNWLGLQNSRGLPDELARWARFDSSWPAHLKPESFEPRFEPQFGLLIDSNDLAAMRERHNAHLRAHGSSPFTKAADKARDLSPETMIRDFVNFWGDTRYCRERDHGNALLATGPVGHGVHLAIAALLLRDKALMRLAARFAMSLAMCGRWDDGMICYAPGVPFEHRCFVQSLCVQDVALVLDLCGEAFTHAGREILMRRVSEEGLGAINFNTWKHEYIFRCNQLAWFTPGRMLGYTMLEKSFPRTKRYTEIAYDELVESLGYAILRDGGYVEGPTYFRCVGRDGGLGLYYYARARGKTLADVIPDTMKSTADFAEAVMSTDDDKDVIPICDAYWRLDSETLAVMASALPGSAWVSIFRKAIARTNGMPDSVLACKLEREVPAHGPAPKPFVFLPEMGVMASTRKLGDARVKLLIMGNKAGAGHTHADKGSFVLEYAGETFAMDPGTCDYSSPLAGQLQHCQRHNMLLPTGTVARPTPACPLPHDVKPIGSGDATSFQATIDATPGWDAFYEKWTRRWESPTPDTLAITDEYEISQGDGVEFLWNTTLPVKIEGHVITITGSRGRATITAEPGDAIVSRDLPLLDGRVQKQVAICRSKKADKIQVRVRLTPV